MCISFPRNEGGAGSNPHSGNSRRGRLSTTAGEGDNAPAAVSSAGTVVRSRDAHCRPRTPCERGAAVKLDSAVKQAREFVHPFRVTDGSEFRLKDVDPGDTLGYGSADRTRAQEALANGVEALAALQDMLYAQDRWAVLLVFQAMDAAGKDGAIKHVMSGVNPQGCQVYSFKAPSPE